MTDLRLIQPKHPSEEVERLVREATAFFDRELALGTDPDCLGITAMKAAFILLEREGGRKYAASMARCFSYASDWEMELLQTLEMDVGEEMAAAGAKETEYVSRWKDHEELS